MTRARTDAERGFTLAEVIIATFILAIGLVAVATGFQFATSSIASGRGETTAVFLAEQRIEQLKAIAVTNYDSIAAGVTTEFCLPTNIGTTASNCQTAAVTFKGPSYTRVTTVVDNPGGVAPCTGVSPFLCKRIQVKVTYRPVTSRGDVSQGRSVDMYTVVTKR
jgi:prepilin-type N-terminal cleavage/methylation domain-containing protein